MDSKYASTGVWERFLPERKTATASVDRERMLADFTRETLAANARLVAFLRVVGDVIGHYNDHEERCSASPCCDGPLDALRSAYYEFQGIKVRP